VKQSVKRILKETKFNRLNCFERIIDESNTDQNVVLIREYYGVDVRWNEPNFCSSVRFRVDLDPLTLDDVEVSEDDDKLLIPRLDRYALD
jgi:hypothetical protein